MRERRSRATAMHLGGLYKTACGKPVHGRGATQNFKQVTCKPCIRSGRFFGSTVNHPKVRTTPSEPAA